MRTIQNIAKCTKVDPLIFSFSFMLSGDLPTNDSGVGGMPIRQIQPTRDRKRDIPHFCHPLRCKIQSGSTMSSCSGRLVDDAVMKSEFYGISSRNGEMYM